MEEEKGILKDKGWVVLVFAGVQVLFIILCAISIPKLFVKDKVDENNYDERPSLKVTGLSETMTNASDKDIGTLERSLLNMVENNTPAVNFRADDAVVRDGSVRTHYFVDESVYYYSAIVDIPSLEQSYWVFHEYSSDLYNQFLNKDDRYIVMCLADTMEIRYPEFNCKSEYEQLTYNAVVQKYLGWFDFDGALARVKDDFKTVEIEIIRGMYDYSDEEYLRQVKEAIESLGIPSELFKYEIIDSEYSPHVHRT